MEKIVGENRKKRIIMKRAINRVILAAAVVAISTSCYDDYAKDYETSSVYFAAQQPLRTVIAERDMSVSVGVSIGGKRSGYKSDWASYTIGDQTALDEAGLTLLPESYYTLSNANTFTVPSSSMLPIAEVEINFTEDFYNDPLSVGQHYALPFTITDSSLDRFVEGKESSIVGFKYISTFHGTYYTTNGLISQIASDGTTVEDSWVYTKSDITANAMLEFTTISRNEIDGGNQVVTAGLTKINLGKVLLTFDSENKAVAIEAGAGNTTYVADSGVASYSYVVDENSANKDERLHITIKYRMVQAGVTYEVKTTLIRRADPLAELRFEEWV